MMVEEHDYNSNKLDFMREQELTSKFVVLSSLSLNQFAA